MSLTIRVEVDRRDGKPYRDGKATVFINGVKHVALRSCESIEIEVPDPTFTTTVDQPLGLNDRPAFSTSDRPEVT